MDAENKQRRFLTENEMLSILESSETELQQVQPKLDEIAAQVFEGNVLEPGIYAHFVKSGVYSAATVRDPDGEPQFVLIYSRSPLNWLYIEAVATIKRSSLKQIFAAVDELARHYGCHMIQCVTKLAGMFRFSQRVGYKSVGVIILKNALPA